jgi:hypothetical protein
MALLNCQRLLLLWSLWHVQIWGTQKAPFLWFIVAIRGWEDRIRWCDSGSSFRVQLKIFWLVVWNMAFIFTYIGNSNPNWLSYFSEGLKHQPDIVGCKLWFLGATMRFFAGEVQGILYLFCQFGCLFCNPISSSCYCGWGPQEATLQNSHIFSKTGETLDGEFRNNYHILF